MRKYTTTGLFLLALFITTFAEAQSPKFAYVNSSELLSVLPDVKGADADLEAMQKQLQKKGQGMVDQLQLDYMLIQQKIERGEISPKQQEVEGKKLESRQKEIAKFEQDIVGLLEAKRNELMKPVLEKVNNAISMVAKENGFLMIFEKSVLLFAEEYLDVTGKVKAKLGK